MEATPVEQTTPAAGARPLWIDMFNRIFSRHAMNIAVLMVLPMLLAPALNSERTLLADPDIWWHLADARVLLTTHHFIRTEPFAFTVVGQHWINWEWLSEIPYWLGYRDLGLKGLYLVTWLAFCANILIVYWRGYWMTRHAGAAFWAAGIGFVLMTVNSGPRTIVIAYLAMSVELAIMEASERGNKRWLWLLPPLFAVWINLHGSWVIGIGLLGLYILCGLFTIKLGVFEQDALSSSDRNRLLAVLGASIAALFLNPYGWELIWSPFDMMLNQTVNIGTVSEWKPLRLTTPEGKFVVLAICLMVVANCIRGRKWKIFELAVVFFAWYAAFDHVRFSFLAAVVTIPLLAKDIERSFCTESDTKTIPVMNALMVGAAAIVIVLMFPTENQLQKKLAATFPLETIASIQPAWRIFDWDTLGGMMMFQSKPHAIDSRFEIFEHHGVLQDYLRIMYVNDALELLDKYRIDHVLVQEAMPLSYLLQHTPGWHLVRRETTREGLDFVLYAKIPAMASASTTSPPTAVAANQ